MKKVIDNMTSLTGWTASGGASVYALNDIKNYIAGNNNKSIIFKFNGLNGYVQKTYTEDVSDYDELIFWIHSTSKGKNDYDKTTDYLYKIDLGSGKEYYLPVFDTFCYVKIYISDITTIDRIRITALHSDSDSMVISYMIANRDVFPYDIFQSIKEQIDYERDTWYSLKTIGSVNTSVNDDKIEFQNSVDYLDRYCVIKIDDGVNSEIHHINRRDGYTFYFSGLFDGATILNSFTNATVYLYYPVEYGTTQKEILMPAITVWGFAPERILITNELDKIIDTVKTNNDFYERQVGHYLKWTLLIDCIAKEEWELLGEISEIVRKTISKKIIWINGRKGYIDHLGPSTEIYPTEDFDVVPKIQYSVNFILREELYNNIVLPITTTINNTINIVEQGELQ